MAWFGTGRKKTAAAAPAEGVGGRRVSEEQRQALLRADSPVDLDLVASLSSLPLRARYLVESFLAGRHRSPIKGSSPEFAEYRSYQPHDDLRRLDWRLYGRSDRLCVRQYEDENQMQVCLALDLSDSMRYAGPGARLSKLDYARTQLAALSLLARRQQDAVGLALLGRPAKADPAGHDLADGLLDFQRPGASLANHHRVFSRLEHPPAARPGDLGRALCRLASVLPRGALLVVASDFYGEPDALAEGLALLRGRRVELLALQVFAPMELSFGEDVAGRFVDLETSEYLPLNTRAVREGYLRRLNTFRGDLRSLFQEQGVAHLEQSCDANPLPGLSAFLAARSRLT